MSLKITKNNVMNHKWIKFDLDGIIFKFKVYGFEEHNDWVKTSWRIKFEDIISYQRDHEEVFTKDCIDYLIDHLKDHLNNRIKRIKTIDFIEPDFQFVFKPQERQYDGITHKELKDVIDIQTEMKIYFWHRGATLNHISITFERKDIQKLYEYLVAVKEKEGVVS